jgi:predicted kinase
MPICYITIGNVGEKKSTWARQKVKQDFDTLIVSKDAIREMIYGEYGYKYEIERVVSGIALHSITTILLDNKNVIIDETNLSSNKRRTLITNIKTLLSVNEGAPARFVYVHFGSTTEGLERRIKDPRNMTAAKWTEVWKGLHSLYEPPTYDEGVDEIIDMCPRQTLTDKMRKYCSENNLPFVMPENCMCPFCRQSFLHLVGNDSTKYITSCPICNRSFLE